MIFRALIVALCVVAFATQVQGQSDEVASGDIDSLAMLMADKPVAIVAAQLGDSLFVISQNKARIFRDGYGVPHIYGQTDRDVAFGFGFAQAEDHLLEMMLSFRQAKGQLSELQGKEAFETDYKALLWRMSNVAGERFGDIPKPTREYIQAFADGINHYITIHRRVLPAYVSDVSAVDVVALSRWILFLFAEQTGMPELKQKGLVPTVQKLPGSNQWAVGASKSATGAPLFVMDLQMPWQTPFRMCEAHLVSNEGLNVSGATFFGLPVIFSGHNSQIAWSMTANDIDVFDLYEERLDPANARRYFYQDEKRRMTSRRVKIKVRGGPGEGIAEVERELLYTSHGPVYKTIDNWAYAARTTMEDQVGAIDQLLAMNKAVGYDGFRQALARLALPVFNVMYADIDGTLYSVFNGRSPMRSTEFNWQGAVPGWAPETEWQGIHTFSQLPQVLNPTSMFLQNCQVAPHLVTVESGISANAYPPYLGWGGFNHPGQRVLNYLLTHSNISVAEMQTLTRDVYLIDAEELKGLILRAYNRTWANIYDPDGQVGMAVNLLREWDNRATRESLGTLLFSEWKQRFDPLLAQIPDASGRDIYVQEKLAIEALRSAVEYMQATYGRLDVRWGEVHVLTRGDQTFPMSGPLAVTPAVHQTWAKRDDQGRFNVVGGSAYVMVVSLQMPVQSWSLLAFGNSEQAASPHYADQAVLQSTDDLKRVVSNEQALQANMRSITTVPFEDDALEHQMLKAFWKTQQKLYGPVMDVDMVPER